MFSRLLIRTYEIVYPFSDVLFALKGAEEMTAAQLCEAISKARIVRAESRSSRLLSFARVVFDEPWVQRFYAPSSSGVERVLQHYVWRGIVLIDVDTQLEGRSLSSEAYFRINQDLLEEFAGNFAALLSLGRKKPHLRLVVSDSDKK